jgi:ParB-like chromosome segregation protein Spo0J
MADELKYHPASMIFPMMSDEETDGLVEDIRDKGLHDPIVLYEGMVLDGRNRLTCCRLAGVDPKFTQYEGNDPVDYVISKNRHRRHLTRSQLAMAAAKASEVKCQLKEQASARRRASQKNDTAKAVLAARPELLTGNTRDHLGAAFGVSGTSVQRAIRVLESGNESLEKLVVDGELTITQADRISRLPPARQEAAIEEAKNGGKRASPLPVDSGDELPEGVSRGKGVRFANEAIDCLKRIPKNDLLRNRGFQIVTDWIRRNK